MTTTERAELPLGSGDLDGHLRDRALLLARPGTLPIRVSGPDRVDFLHGQLSSDVRGLQVQMFQRTLQLSHRGHVLASADLFARDSDLYLAADAGGDLLLASLRQHVIFDQVVIEDLRGTLVTVALVGGLVPTLLDELGVAPPTPGRFDDVEVAGAKVLMNRASWSLHGAIELHLLARDLAEVESVVSAAGAEPGPLGLPDSVRVAAGLASAADAGDGVLPQEIGLGGAVAPRKGCYLGQEIMARIEARGTLRRSAARVVLETVPPAGERDLVAGGRKVGRLGAVALGYDGAAIALAALRTDLAPEAGVTVGGVAITSIDRL